MSGASSWTIAMASIQCNPPSSSRNCLSTKFQPDSSCSYTTFSPTRKQYVRTNTEMPSTTTKHTLVNQGCMLSGLQLILHTPSSKTCKILKYTDNTVMESVLIIVIINKNIEIRYFILPTGVRQII